MFIVEYTEDYRGYTEKTITFTENSSVIDFIAGKSSDKDFKLTRINKYEKGVLYPYELKINSGRIVLESAPLNVKGEVK